MNNTQTEEKILQVPIEEIIPNRFQPRLAFDDDSLKDLADSIKQHGIIQPLVLRRKNDKYEIIAGERRYKAARMAGLVSVPAIISNLSDQASAEVAIVENVQRKDLTAIEEAKSYQALLDKGYMTQEELAKKMGLSQSAISNKLRLLTLAESVQQAVIKEQISERHARSLLKVKDHEMQKVLLNKIITERLTVKQLEDEIKKVVVDTPASDTPVAQDQPTPNISANISTPQVEVPKPMNSLESIEQSTANAINAINSLMNMSSPKENTPEALEPTKPDAPTQNTSNTNVVDTDDIPIIKSTPNIENIVNNAVDIALLNNSGTQTVAPTIQANQPNPNVDIKAPVTPFSQEPEKMPSKFFNYLESQAANLDLDEKPTTFELPPAEEPPKPVDLINQTDNIEMLDDFVVPTTPSDNGKIMNNDYLDQVIKTVRGLNFDSDKVVIEEMNLPTEYQITIKIKKDKI